MAQNKCFVFAIGGTGSRVLRSLTMLLASGAETGVGEIVPIIIDPDAANADLTRTVALIDKYRAVREKLTAPTHSPEGFFACGMSGLSADFCMQIADTSDKTFARFIDIGAMSRENQALTHALFSDKNLRSSMKVGFKGNPNIGCVVLGQLTRSREFADFASRFAEGDKIFIISSIFGGTGAAGFPLLLKTLRSGDDFPNHSLINRAEIGAVSVLPYFRVRSDEASEIDSSTFISKSVAALGYYEGNVYRDRLANALYFVGDDVANIYENNEGGSRQRNQAHLVEFIAATAALDFCTKSYQPTQCLEFGVKDLISEVAFDKLYPATAQGPARSMARMLLMARCLRTRYDFLSSPHFNANSILHLGSDFYRGEFMRDVRQMAGMFMEWLAEMRDNVRSLNLLRIDGADHPFDIVPSMGEKRARSLKSGYSLYYDRLNREARKVNAASAEANFMDMMYRATDRLLREKVNV